jgi:hypothetical protein
MSILDPIYKTIPSVWSEIFRDKSVIDSMYMHGIKSASDSYTEILRTYLANYLGYDNFLVTRSCSTVLFILEDIIDLVDDSGDIYMQIIPVTSNAVRAQLLSYNSEIKGNDSILSSDSFDIVYKIEELNDLRDRILDSQVAINSPKYLVTYEYPIFKKNVMDSQESSIKAARLIKANQGLLDSQPILDLKNSIIPSLIIQIHELSSQAKIIRVQIKKHNIVEDSTGDLTIVLDTKNRLTNEGRLILTIGNTQYSASCYTVDTSITYYTMYLLNAVEESYDLIRKFPIPSEIDHLFMSTTEFRNFIYSVYKISIEGASKYNINHLASTLDKVPLIEFGTSNGESFLNYNTIDNILVSNYKSYTLKPGKLPSMDIIRSTSYINGEPAHSLAILIDNTISLASIAKISRLVSYYTEYDLNLSVVQITLKVNSSNDVYGLVALGSNYILLAPPIGFNHSDTTQISKIELVFSTTKSVVINTTHTYMESLYKPEFIEYKQPVSTLVLTYSNKDSSLESLVSDIAITLPNYLYSTTEARRIVSSKEFEVRVGYMPVHLVGDYKIFVGWNSGIPGNINKAKSSSYYLLQDFYSPNCIVMHFPYIDRPSSSYVTSLVKLLEDIITSGSIILTSYSTPLLDTVDYFSSMSDKLRAIIKIALHDSSAMHTEDIRLVQASTTYKYLSVSFAYSHQELSLESQIIIHFSKGEIATSTNFQLSEDGTTVGIMLDADIDYEVYGEPITCNAIGVVDFCIVGVVGHSSDALNELGKSVVGSSLPYTSKVDTSVNIQETHPFYIISRGPKITIKEP